MVFICTSLTLGFIGWFCTYIHDLFLDVGDVSRVVWDRKRERQRVNWHFGLSCMALQYWRYETWKLYSTKPLTRRLWVPRPDRSPDLVLWSDHSPDLVLWSDHCATIVKEFYATHHIKILVTVTLTCDRIWSGNSATLRKLWQGRLLYSWPIVLFPILLYDILLKDQFSQLFLL